MSTMRRLSVNAAAGAAQSFCAGDALILALAAQYRALTVAIDALDKEMCAWTGTMHRYLESQHNTACDRRDSLHDAMCAIPASGLPGALVQIELLSLMNETSSDQIDDAYRRQHVAAMRKCLIFSIFHVIARETGRTAADGLEVMLPSRTIYAPTCRP